MSEKPSKDLRAVSANVYNGDDGDGMVYTFNDGSVWTNDSTEGWVCQWKPETSVTIQSEFTRLVGMMPDGKMQISPANSPVFLKAEDLHSLGSLKAEIEAWKNAHSVAVSSEKNKVEKIKKLEAEIKAWKDAASLNLVPDDEEPLARYETPESLADRLRGLYRWATQAEKHGTESSKEVGAFEKSIDAWRKAANVDADKDHQVLIPEDLGSRIRNLLTLISKLESGERIRELEAQLEAWKLAASVELDKGIPVGAYGVGTPDALAEKIRHLISISTGEPTLEIARVIATAHEFFRDRTNKLAKANAACLEAWQGISPMPKPYRYKLNA